jgi:hypothetical protein
VCLFNFFIVYHFLYKGKVFDKSEFLESLRGSGGGSGGGGGGSMTPAAPPARLRGKAAAARARPKTIHVDSGALHAAEGMLAKQPSSTNLTGTHAYHLAFSNLCGTFTLVLKRLFA